MHFSPFFQNTKKIEYKKSNFRLLTEWRQQNIDAARAKKTMLQASAWSRPRSGLRRSFWDPECWVKRKGVLRAAEWITIRFGLRFSPFFYLRTPYFKVLSVRSPNKPLFGENLGINAILFRFFSTLLFTLFSWSRFVPAAFSYPYFLTVLCWWIVRPLVDQEGEEHIVRMILYFFSSRSRRVVGRFKIGGSRRQICELN